MSLYGQKLWYILGIGLIFLLISIIKAIEAKHSMDFRTIVQIGLIVMPAIYVFCFINIFSVKEIIRLMQITLIALILIYFCEPEHPLSSFFNISNWTNISFSEFTSFTESSLCAESFLQLFLFFYYFSKIKNQEYNVKQLKICTWVAFAFTIFSFKRLAMVFVIGIIILEKIVDYRGRISPKLIMLTVILFTSGTIVYTRFMQGEIFTNIDTFKFSTGRDYILSLWKNKAYFSYGYGTSMLVIGRYLEMDLVEIYMELGIFATFIFNYGFFKITNNNIYPFLIMGYAFMNMLTASSLPWSLGWIVLLTTVSVISSDKCKDENIEIGIKKYRFKRLFDIEMDKKEEIKDEKIIS